MNGKHLGDALDHFKGSVFAFLQQDKVLRNFLVDPMATDDASPWQASYARLLRVKPDQLVRHEHALRQDRKRYFSEIPRDGDIFLDPDTGIRTNGNHDLDCYLQPTELLDLIDAAADRLVVIYQHSRMSVRQRVQGVWEALNQQNNLFSCSYELPPPLNVALIFFSRTSARVEAVRDCFCGLLGPRAQDRIGSRNF